MQQAYYGVMKRTHAIKWNVVGAATKSDALKRELALLEEQKTVDGIIKMNNDACNGM
jgi:hypothetical protein